jgi:hypothetical protein
VDAEQEQLTRDVMRYAKDVAAYLCVSRRKKLTHKPATVVEVILLQHDQQERQIHALEGIEDMLRVRVSCCSSFGLVCFLV